MELQTSNGTCPRMRTSRMSSNRSMSAILLGIVLTFLTITVVVDGRITIEPNPNGEVGMMSSDTKYFNCKSDTKGHYETLAWIDPSGREIVNDPANRVYVSSKRNTIKLELKSPNKGDSGPYKCVARNKANQETATAFFKLHVFNPTVLEGQTNYLKSEGQRVMLECNARSDRDASIEFNWMFGNFDLSQEPGKYRIETQRARSGSSNDEVRTISRLEIRNVTKEHDGKYTCSVDTTNRYLSDEKEIRIQLHVQYKPRFDEKTPRYIWISEEAIQQQGPMTVNISCLVYADPVAKISWSYGSPVNGPVIPTTGRLAPGAKYQVSIEDNENMSILSVTYRTIEEIRNPRPNSRIRYVCSAVNTQGNAAHQFEIKVGRIPDSPKILSIDYKDGSIILALNESNVEPPIDIYRLEIADDQAHLFNKSASTPNSMSNGNNTYVIELNLPRGDHKVNIYAHNPVGWSENPSGPMFLTVVSGSATLITSWIATISILIIGQMLTESRSIGSFFI